jgi:hypothetical protein
MGCGYDSDPEAIFQKSELERIAKGKLPSGNVTAATKRKMMESANSKGTPATAKSGGAVTPSRSGIHVAEEGGDKKADQKP